MTISSEKDNNRQECLEADSAELSLYFLTRSQGAWRDADNSANSPRMRLLCYFDAGYFAVLAALDSELPLTLQDGWDFASMLKLAGEKLGLTVADVIAGVSLSQVAYDIDAPEPDTRHLDEAAAWASRVQGIVGFRLGMRPPALRSIPENPE